MELKRYIDLAVRKEIKRYNDADMDFNQAKAMFTKIASLDKEGAKQIDELEKTIMHALRWIKTGKQSGHAFHGNDVSVFHKNLKSIQRDIDKKLQTLASTSKKAFDLFSKMEAEANKNSELWEAADGILID